MRSLRDHARPVARVFLLAGAVCGHAVPSRAALAQEEAAARPSPLRAVVAPAPPAPAIDSGIALAGVTPIAAALGVGASVRWPARSVAVAIDDERGALRRAQEPSRSTNGGITAAGWRASGRWRADGRFAWARRTDVDLPWTNASSAYLGSPYVWADSTGGTWRRDVVSLDGRLSARVGRAWRLGVEARYGVGQGARQNGARPLYRRRVLEASPSIAVALGPHVIGAWTTIGWLREDQEIGGAGALDDPVVFRLRGVSTFDRTQLNSAERAVIGGVLGGGAGWARHGERWALRAHAGVRLVRDSVRDGIATPLFGGGVVRERVDAAFAARRALAHGGVSWEVDAAHEQADGRDPVFLAVNQRDAGTTWVVRSAWWSGDRDASRARWHLALTFDGQTVSRRDAVAATSWEVQRTRVVGGVQWRPRASDGGPFIGVSMLATPSRVATFVPGAATRITPLLGERDAQVVGSARTGGAMQAGWEFVEAGSRRARITAAVARQQGDDGLDPARALGARGTARFTVELF